MKKAILMLTLVALCSGCLEKDITQTIYLEADGSVTWEVLEQDVYSSSSKAVDREREEAEYLSAALAGRPSIVESLEEIGGRHVSSELLRDRRPYSLRATAHFNNLEAALGGLLRAAEIGGEVRLTKKGDRRILTITPPEPVCTVTQLESGIDDRGEDAGADVAGVEDDESDSDDWAMLELLSSDEMRFVLSEGQFEEAVGFELLDGGRAAMWSEEAEERCREVGRFRLVWTAAIGDGM